MRSERPPWRRTLDERYPHWSKEIDARDTRIAQERISEEGLVQLELQILERCSGARSESTWDGIATVANQFERFEQTQTLAAYHLQPLDNRMTQWLQSRINAGLSIASAVIYYRKLHQMYKMLMASESFRLQEFGRGLLRDPASVPTGERALRVSEMQTLLDKARTHAWWSQLFVQWSTASRTDDLRRLHRRDILVETHLIILNWESGTKSGVDKRADFIPTPPLRLLRYLRGLAPDEKAFPFATCTVTQMIRRTLVRAGLPKESEATVGSHPVKKGALTQLLVQKVPVHEVMFKAKHKTLQTLQTYVGATTWAEAHSAAETSVILTDMLSA